MFTPESHNHGTPLSSRTPFVPLVVEWLLPAQVQITWSPALMVTLVGENTVPVNPTVTLVLAAKQARERPDKTRQSISKIACS